MGGSLSEGRADCLPRGKPFGVSVGANSFIPLACRLSEGVQGASGKPPAGMTRDNFAEEIPLWRGLTRRLRREGRACSPMGRSMASSGDPKGCRGASGKPPAGINKRQLCRRNSPLMGLDAPTPAREKGLQPYGALYCFGWRSEGGAGGERKAPLLAPQRETSAEEVPLWRGLTRRLRRELGLAGPRGAHTFLSVAKEKCAKESQRHGDSGKKAPIAHFDGGARNVARILVR